MARVKRSVHGRKHHRAVLEQAKGYYGNKSRTFRAANEQLLHSMQYAYRDRRARKGDFRKLWIQRINAAARQNGMSYSRFIAGLHQRRRRGGPQDPGRPGRHRRRGLRRPGRAGSASSEQRRAPRRPPPDPGARLRAPAGPPPAPAAPKRATRWAERAFVAEGVEVVRSGARGRRGARVASSWPPRRGRTRGRGPRSRRPLGPRAPDLRARRPGSPTGWPTRSPRSRSFGVVRHGRRRARADLGRPTLAVVCVDVARPGQRRARCCGRATPPGSTPCSCCARHGRPVQPEDRPLVAPARCSTSPLAVQPRGATGARVAAGRRAHRLRGRRQGCRLRLARPRRSVRLRARQRVGRASPTSCSATLDGTVTIPMARPGRVAQRRGRLRGAVLRGPAAAARAARPPSGSPCGAA